ncbi:hypothetical protein [Pseudoalteromonas aurantia]|uniref:Uncharacterized protein n=1 Tax=Pseudoalteromonas aurantia TaxID=43654 RepID=A0A5S3V385_9GAMM|nr:hypothetical protein [Pseudoalteromonas aurantia]TMO64441.1 hypothetical protein CWC19_18390 [Pseudoalteromonas aurantia]
MSYLSEPQNTDVLAQILLQLDPGQHDAVTLMHGIAHSQTALSTAVTGLLKRELQTFRNNNVLTNIVSQNAAQNLTLGADMNAATETLVELSKVRLQNVNEQIKDDI